jgi:hypothetical protein
MHERLICTVPFRDRLHPKIVTTHGDVFGCYASDDGCQTAPARVCSSHCYVYAVVSSCAELSSWWPGARSPNTWRRRKLVEPVNVRVPATMPRISCDFT